MSMKLFILMLLLAVISGCIAGEKKENTEHATNTIEVTNTTGVADTREVTMKNISISSDAFRDGETIPAEYTCDGKDISPILTWNGIPEGTKSIALIMDDPDAPRGTFVHWVLYNIPAETQKLPKAIPRNQTLGDGSRHGITDFGRVGYEGPCPPPGKPHRYYFKIYALDTKLDLPAGASKTDVEKAMKGHILAKGELIGKYGR